MATVPLGRSFSGLWTATGTTNLADGIALFSLPLLALAAGASPGGVAAVTAAMTLAWPVFGMHAGLIVDRLDRRAVLIGVNVLRAAVLAVLTAAYLTDQLTLVVILVAALLLGAGETVADTGVTSTVPLVVEAHQRSRANARIEATINLTNQMAGPPLAGVLAGLTLALATGASAALYALALAGLMAMTLRRGAPAEAERPARIRLSGGLTFLWRQRVLRTITLFTAAMNLVWAAAVALLVVYAVEPGPLGLSPAQYGMVLTAMAAGGLAAAAVLERLRVRFGVTTLMIADCVGTVLLVAPVALGTGTWGVVTGVVVAGAGSSIWRILVATIRQNLTPPELLGRVYAASRVISWGVLPVGAALAGVGAELWGVRVVYAVATTIALATLLAFVIFAARNDLSTAMEPRPVPVPE